MSQSLQCPEQLIVDQAHRFISIYTPAVDADANQLISIMGANRDYFAQQIAERGVLVFRGFAPKTPEVFHEIVTGGMGFDPWNAFNTGSMPGFVASWMRRYSESLLGAGDYRRYLEKNTVQLGPAEQSIQGPHTEGGVGAKRSRYLIMCCFEPAPYLGETGMVNLHEVFQALPENMRTKYEGANNRFHYISGRKLNLLDHFLLKYSPFEVSKQKDGFAKLGLQQTPFVCKVPETGELCLQPWAFARNTNRISMESAQSNFEGRGTLQPDSTAEGMNLTWGLNSRGGGDIEWGADEQRVMFDTIYARAHLYEWQRGDIAFVDNIKIGHWRMNGEQGNRKIVQIQAEPFDAWSCAS